MNIADDYRKEEAASDEEEGDDGSDNDDVNTETPTTGTIQSVS